MSCYNCEHEFKENEGRYRHSDGMLCVECENNIENLKLTSNETLFKKDSPISFLKNEELQKYGINGDLLQQYATLTDNLKFFTTIEVGKPDMNIVCNLVTKKESLLKELFANANLPYTLLSTDLTAQKFLHLVNEWTEDKIKCTAN